MFEYPNTHFVLNWSSNNVVFSGGYRPNKFDSFKQTWLWFGFANSATYFPGQPEIAEDWMFVENVIKVLWSGFKIQWFSEFGCAQSALQISTEDWILEYVIEILSIWIKKPCRLLSKTSPKPDNFKNTWLRYCYLFEFRNNPLFNKTTLA